MSMEGRNVPHSNAKEDLEVPRHKCCWVAILSLCLLTVNSIVCIHLARRLAYVEGQLAKQGVSASKKTLTEGRFGYHTELEMSDEAKVHPATVVSNNTKGHRPYNDSTLPPSPREHQNRKKRSSFGKEVFGVEGGHVDLRCDSEYDPSRTLFWEVINRPYWNIQVLIKEPGRGIEIREPRYAGRLSLRDGNNLRISNLSRDDDSVDSTDSVFVGTYRCAQQGAVGTEWIIRVRPNFLFRLSGGRKLNEGRVELQKRQAGWGTICQTGWDIHDADVLCRQLGHSRATPKSVNFGPGSGPIWLSDVRCIGNESTILDCPFKLRDNDCDHDDDVGVVCDLDECYSNPCQNNGTCIDGGEHYICQCGRGWVGVHCEIREKLSSMEVTSFNWAHIEAVSDSQSDTHTVKRDETVLTKQWEQIEPSDKFRFHSGILTVLEEGDYYVYSQVYYWYNSIKSPAASHSVMVVKTDKDNPYRFLTCWKNMQKTDPWNTCYTAGVIHLYSNSSVYLHMRCDGCVIKLEHDATFFGVMKLSNARGQHKIVDMNMHGEKSSSDRATPDKVEDVPPTVVSRDHSGKSWFEKLVKSNFRTILNELPNGTRYRVTRRGKIVLR